jgi:hypothetical protein
MASRAVRLAITADRLTASTGGTGKFRPTLLLRPLYPGRR